MLQKKIDMYLLFYCCAILPASFPDGSLAILRASSPVIRVLRSPLFATKVRNEAPAEETAILPYKGKKTYEMYQRIALSYRFDQFLLKEDEAKTKCSGIINLLFGVLVDNTC